MPASWAWVATRSRSRRCSATRRCASSTAMPKPLSTTTRTRTYQTVRRPRSDSVLLLFALHSKLIAFTAAGSDERRLPGRIELPPESLNVDIDDVRERVVVLVPDVLGNFAATVHGPRVPRQILEE